MPNNRLFAEQIARLRAGDDAAVREFVALYEPFIRRSLRRRLARSKLQAVADSGDLCQSVLGSFLIRVAAGEYELATAEDLQKLLMTMAKNKMAALLRREHTQKRDHNRVKLLESGDDISNDSAEDPARRAADNDLLEQVRRRLNEEEKDLFQKRQAGQTWEMIAEEGDGSAVVLRKRLSRALKRVAIELGLENDDE